MATDVHLQNNRQFIHILLELDQLSLYVWIECISFPAALDFRISLYYEQSSMLLVESLSDLCHNLRFIENSTTLSYSENWGCLLSQVLQTQELMIGRVTGNEKLHTRYPRSYVPRILETRYPYLRNHLPCTPSSRLCTCTLETITSTRNLTNRWNNSPMFAYWKEKHNSGSICLSHVTCCAILILILKSQGLHLS